MASEPASPWENREIFRSIRHRWIYARMVSLADSSRPVDLVVLVEDLSRGRELEAVRDGLQRCLGCNQESTINPPPRCFEPLEGWSQSFRCCGSVGWNRERSEVKLLAKPCWHDSGTGGLPRCREGPA